MCPVHACHLNCMAGTWKVENSDSPLLPSSCLSTPNFSFIHPFCLHFSLSSCTLLGCVCLWGPDWIRSITPVRISKVHRVVITCQMVGCSELPLPRMARPSEMGAAGWSSLFLGYHTVKWSRRENRQWKNGTETSSQRSATLFCLLLLCQVSKTGTGSYFLLSFLEKVK